jgi:phosphonate transport system ATP-binding protein
MLADEPVASLDPASAERVMEYLKKASRKYDIATLTSLHQVNIARYFGDRFIGLRDGQVVFDGDQSELTQSVIDDLYGEVETVGMGVPDESTATRNETNAAAPSEHTVLGEAR